MPWVDDDNAALLVDFYELTMAASYFAAGMNEPATFDLFVRSLPPNRNFLVAAGLDDALHYLEALHFGAGSIAYLRSLGIFRDDFLAFLGRLRFTGGVRAVSEGEVVFAGEPLLTVTAPLIEAQIVETFLLNCINFQTMVASKAARVTIACAGRSFVDFSPRRDHGADAALRAARACYIAGASATSNVLAGQVWGIPLSGTMAHSYVMAFQDEAEAFRRFAADFPDRSTLLIDTYDTVEGARKVVDLVRAGSRVQAVRLDSGDLPALAHQVRHILDEGGCRGVRIFASGDLDEYSIAALLRDSAPIDAFGVGTRVGTSSDAPYLSGVYKLVETAGRPVHKLAPAKATLPGRKQVWRRETAGVLTGDIVALDDEPVADARPLLAQVMQGGRRLAAAPGLDALRSGCAGAVAALPAALRELETSATPYPVSVSPGLAALSRRLSA